MRSTSTSGFALLETVFAWAILAMAIIGLIIVLKTSLETANRSQRERDIHQELENRLARLRVDPRTEFREESTHLGVTYIEETFPENVIKFDHSALNGYRRIKVTAKWQDRHGPQQRDASFLVFAP